ncbi:hypothetical protein FGO68_gene10699 [Halteria grandinella]|uniref:Uncharacterized protein n=1 Tax=Halteria grandinella TaxID=5974 RepID=A0A8J8NDK1_HALGN|nr:hypothetical protein FGO68_gene10699 [Halteria grandinella]
MNLKQQAKNKSVSKAFILPLAFLFQVITCTETERFHLPNHNKQQQSSASSNTQITITQPDYSKQIDSHGIFRRYPIKAEQNESHSMIDNFIIQPLMKVTDAMHNANRLKSNAKARMFSQEKIERKPNECVQCINHGSNYCFNATWAKCCSSGSQEDGCKESSLNAIKCTVAQGKFVSAGMMYESCPANPSKLLQCGPLEQLTLEDNLSWQSLDIDLSNPLGICSYTLSPIRSDTPASDANFYQLIFEDYSNIQLGIYYYSESNNGALIDLGFLDPERPEECVRMDTCVYGEDFVMFNIPDSMEVHVTVIPINQGDINKVKMSARLINQEEKEFVVHTLVLMGIGFLVIFGFLIVMFKTLNVEQ